MYFLFLMFLIKLDASAATENPQNVAAIVGSEVVMSCEAKSSKSIAWFRDNIKMNKGNSIISTFQGYNFSISNGDVPGRELQIKAVSLEHAGAFKCAADGEDKFAELVVLDSQPQCEVTNSTKTKELRCSVTFRGNWKPNITWTYKGSALPGHSKDTNDTVSSTVEANGNGSTDYSEYSCTVYFTSGSAKGPGYAKNLPSNFSCNLGDSYIDIFQIPISYDWRMIIPSATVELLLIVLLSIMIIILISKRKRTTETMDGNNRRRSVAQQREIEIQTTEDETIQEYVDHGEQLPQMETVDGTSNKSSVQQRVIEARTTENERTQEYVNITEELPQMGDDSTKYYNFQIQEPEYLELCGEDSKYEGLAEHSFQTSTVYDPLCFH